MLRPTLTWPPVLELDSTVALLPLSVLTLILASNWTFCGGAGIAPGESGEGAGGRPNTGAGGIPGGPLSAPPIVKPPSAEPPAQDGPLPSDEKMFFRFLIQVQAFSTRPMKMSRRLLM